MECLCCNGDGFIWEASEVPSIECYYCKKSGETGLLKYLYWKYIIERNSRFLIFENIWFKIKNIIRR